MNFVHMLRGGQSNVVQQRCVSRLLVTGSSREYTIYTIKNNFTILTHPTSTGEITVEMEKKQQQKTLVYAST